MNLCVSTVMEDAWAKNQNVRVHGWAFGVNDGLLQDLHMTVGDTGVIESVYRSAVEDVMAKYS